MKIHRIISWLILCLMFGSVAQADLAKSSMMENRWKEGLRNGIIVEIKGTFDFTPELQRLFNLSASFTGDFTKGVTLAQFTATQVPEATLILKSLNMDAMITRPSSDHEFADRSSALFDHLEGSKYMKKEPAAYRSGIPRRMLKPSLKNSGMSQSIVNLSACSTGCVSDGFESDVWWESGGDWLHFEAGESNGYGAYIWTDNDCDAHSGYYSVDAIRGGTSGDSLSCSAYYPANLTCWTNASWMEYGYWISCFHDASCANLSFYYKVKSEANYDKFAYWFSDDDDYFWGYLISGSYSNSWYKIDADLTSWYELGDLTSYSQVSFAFAFCSDSTTQTGFGARVDDVAITYTGGSGSGADLAPYQPSGWSDAIVASASSGTNTDSTIYRNETVYFDYAIANNGTADAGPHVNYFYVDGTKIRSGSSDGLDVGYYEYAQDFTYTFTTSGNHTLKVFADAEYDVAESNESNNVYERTVYVSEHGGTCQTNSQTLCLNNNRFQVRVTWKDYQGHTGNGTVVPYGSADSGLFWFFASTNWEMLIKVLNGCGVNGHYWVYAAATTDVEYHLTVTDTSTGATRQYNNALGNASPAITDAAAFDSCP